MDYRQVEKELHEREIELIHQSIRNLAPSLAAAQLPLSNGFRACLVNCLADLLHYVENDDPPKGNWKTRSIADMKILLNIIEKSYY